MKERIFFNTSTVVRHRIMWLLPIRVCWEQEQSCAGVGAHDETAVR